MIKLHLTHDIIKVHGNGTSSMKNHKSANFYIEGTKIATVKYQKYAASPPEDK